LTRTAIRIPMQSTAMTINRTSLSVLSIVVGSRPVAAP
jgi:hypothetical protein